MWVDYIKKRRVTSIKDSVKTSESSSLESPGPNESEKPIRFASATLGAKRHVCAFFNSPDEEYRVLLPFIKEGFERGEKAFHIVNPALREEHLRRLKSAGIDADAAEKDGQLALRNWEDAYLREGRFEQDKMLALIEEVLEGGKQEGFSLTRLVAHMEWALEDRPGVNDLVEYETRLNYLLTPLQRPRDMNIRSRQVWRGDRD